jgi:glycosyltransferase involved in cell wall biosynthesis
LTDRPLNFLHLSTFYPPWSFGGDAIYIHRLARALGDDGHRVDIGHCRDAYDLLHPAAPPASFPGHPNVHVHALGTPIGRFGPLLAHQTGRPLLKRHQIESLLAQRQYDVVHFHNISLLGPGVLEVSASGTTPLKLYTAHEHWLVCPTHVLWKFNREVCVQPQCLQCTLRARRPPQAWRYTGALERAARHVHQFIAPSRFAVASHAGRGFAPPMAALPYFVDRADADWQTPGPRPQERPYFLFVGRLEAIKGLQTVIAAWDRVPEFDLLVAGAGEHERALRAQAARNPRVHFLGHVPQEALGALYVHAVACLVPSLVYETFGIIVIEAFMRKTPVIARDLGSLTEIVEDSGGGLVFRTDDELVAAIERLGRAPEERRALGERGYDAYLRFWSRDAHMTRYYALLAETAQRALSRVPWQD